MTDQEIMDILLYETPFKNTETIQVRHCITFEGNILTDDTTEFIRIMKILQDNRFTGIKHTIYLNKHQEHLTINNTYFTKFSTRLHKYFDILQILLGNYVY